MRGMTSSAAQWSLVAVWSGAAPVFREIAADGDGWLLGRDTEGIGDGRVSRRHCRVTRETDGWKIADLGSANGTYVDGARIDGVVRRHEVTVIQLGRTLVVPLAMAPDVPRSMARTAEAFVGPGLYPAWAATAEAATAGRHLFMIGPRGCGFERLAAHYLRGHDPGGRLSKVQLDHHTAASKVAELPAGAVLVTGSLPMQAYARHPWIAAARARGDLRLCVAFHIDAETELVQPPAEVASHYAIVRVPGLERRCEEIPWWIVHALEGRDPPVEVDITFVEACLLRRWSDNIPPLIAESRDAAAAAVRAGRTTVKARDLSEYASHGLESVVHEVPAGPPRGARRPPELLRDRERFAALVDAHSGDHVKIAAELGVTVEAVAQWLRRHGLADC
jgi:hypothetical protein